MSVRLRHEGEPEFDQLTGVAQTTASAVPEELLTLDEWDPSLSRIISGGSSAIPHEDGSNGAIRLRGRLRERLREPRVVAGQGGSDGRPLSQDGVGLTEFRPKYPFSLAQEVGYREEFPDNQALWQALLEKEPSLRVGDFHPLRLRARYAAELGERIGGFEPSPEAVAVANRAYGVVKRGQDMALKSKKQKGERGVTRADVVKDRCDFYAPYLVETLVRQRSPAITISDTGTFNGYEGYATGHCLSLVRLGQDHFLLLDPTVDQDVSPGEDWVLECFEGTAAQARGYCQRRYLGSWKGLDPQAVASQFAICGLDSLHPKVLGGGERQSRVPIFGGDFGVLPREIPDADASLGTLFNIHHGQSILNLSQPPLIRLHGNGIIARSDQFCDQRLVAVKYRLAPEYQYLVGP